MIIFISGTPATGKTTIATKLSEMLDYDLIKINDFAVENNLVLGIDEDKYYKIIDVEKLDEVLANNLHDNLIVEGHLSHFCLGADLMLILRCHPDILKQRLEARGYSVSKIYENLEAEALGVCSAEALDIYENPLEIDVSNLSVSEILDKIKNNDFTPVGMIDFMDWLVNQ